jgi:hypothetical protein
VNAFSRAEALYRDDPHRKLAIYGRARALDLAGRCEDARTTYAEYAAFVQARDPASAAMALKYAHACAAALPAVPDQTLVAEALMAGDARRALDTATREEQGVRDPQQRAAFDMSRGAALTALGRVDEALSAFDAALPEFGAGTDGREERARALYGKARALVAGARCKEAQRAFYAYAAFVRPFASADAKLAEKYALQCAGPGASFGSKR